MKKLICGLFVFVCALSAHGQALFRLQNAIASNPAIAYVNDCANGNFGTTGVISSTITVGGAQCTNASTVSSGNTLVIVSRASTPASVTLSTPTGTCVSSWTSVSSDSTTGQQTWIGAETTTGGCTVIASGTLTGSSDLTFHVFILSGAITTVRASAYNTQGFCTSSCALPTISANSGDMVIGIMFASYVSTTAIAPYTLGFTSNTGGDSVSAVWYIPGTTGNIASPAYVSDGGHAPVQVSIAVEP